MTREDTKRLLMTVEAIYPNYKIKDTKITLDAWSEILSDQDAQFIFAALKNYSRTDTTGFAPSVGQLVQGAYELRTANVKQLTPGEAWSMVHKAICRSNYYAEEEFEKFPETIKRAVGSFWQLRAWASDPHFNEGVASSNFYKAYAESCEIEKANALMSPDIKKMIESSLDVRLIDSED